MATATAPADVASAAVAVVTDAVKVAMEESAMVLVAEGRYVEAVAVAMAEVDRAEEATDMEAGSVLGRYTAATALQERGRIGLICRACRGFTEELNKVSDEQRNALSQASNL